MKWKITLRFMMAVLAVSIISAIANVFISMYFSYEQYSTQRVFSGILSVGTYISSSEPANQVASGMDNIYVQVQMDGGNIATDDFKMEDVSLTFTIEDRNSDKIIKIKTTVVKIIEEQWVLQVITARGKSEALTNRKALKPIIQNLKLNGRLSTRLKWKIIMCVPYTAFQPVPRT